MFNATTCGYSDATNSPMVIPLVSQDTIFICGECGGEIKTVPVSYGNDFLQLMRNSLLVEVVIPSHVHLPKCDRCGIIYLGYTQAVQLAAQMGGSPHEF